MKLNHILLVTALLLTTGLNVNAQMKQEIKATPDAAESITFLAMNKSAKGVMITPSGLQYKIITTGKGVKPNADDKVSLNYTLSYVNGKNFADGNKTIAWEHHIDKALPGMQEAIVMMPAGSKWILYIPADLAYGEAGYDDVPPGAAFICEIELLKVIK